MSNIRVTFQHPFFFWLKTAVCTTSFNLKEYELYINLEPQLGGSGFGRVSEYFQPL